MLLEDGSPILKPNLECLGFYIRAQLLGQDLSSRTIWVTDYQQHPVVASRADLRVRLVGLDQDSFLLLGRLETGWLSFLT